MSTEVHKYSTRVLTPRLEESGTKGDTTTVRVGPRTDVNGDHKLVVSLGSVFFTGERDLRVVFGVL